MRSIDDVIVFAGPRGVVVEDVLLKVSEMIRARMRARHGRAFTSSRSFLSRMYFCLVVATAAGAVAVAVAVGDVDGGPAGYIAREHALIPVLRCNTTVTSNVLYRPSSYRSS